MFRRRAGPHEEGSSGDVSRDILAVPFLRPHSLSCLQGRVKPLPINVPPTFPRQGSTHIVWGRGEMAADFLASFRCFGSKMLRESRDVVSTAPRMKPPIPLLRIRHSTKMLSQIRHRVFSLVAPITFPSRESASDDAPFKA